MARIRTIKPEFWRDDMLSIISPEAALLAIGLLNVSDDEGYFNANPNILKADIFPLRELSSSTTVLLRELYEIGYVELFIDEDNHRFNRIYGRVVNFTKHQVINKPNKSIIKELSLLPYDYGSDPVELPVGKERKGKEKEKEKEKETPILQSAAHSENKSKIQFDDFYSAYPKKTARKDAEKAWGKIADLDKQNIMADLANRPVNDRQWLDGIIPHPATYLNGERWKDEIIPPKSNGSHAPPQQKTQYPPKFQLTTEIINADF